MQSYIFCSSKCSSASSAELLLAVPGVVVLRDGVPWDACHPRLEHALQVRIHATLAKAENTSLGIPSFKNFSWKNFFERNEFKFFVPLIENS